MAEYKPGQFVKVQNEKGLHRVKKGLCVDCALHDRKCIDHCVFKIGWGNIIAKVK